MPQKPSTTGTGKARTRRSLARVHAGQSVVRRRQAESFQNRWIGPTVIYVVDGGDAWSAFLRRSLAARGMSVSELARRSGLHRTTISEWLNQGVGAITIQSVYLVADALEADRAEALKAAGNLPPTRDHEVDIILSSNRPDAVKAQLIERLMQRREEERVRRVADLEWMLERGSDEAG